MRDASTYRGARKNAMRDAGVKAASVPFRKIDIRQARQNKKGFALPLKAVDGGTRLKPSEIEPGKFLPDPEWPQ
jgi:hypothetical protein